MNESIRGKVACVLSTREIAINVGAADGVVVGMYFNVIDPRYENIKDPDTGEVLGSFEQPKVGVRVIQVKEKVSIASTYQEVQVNLGGSGKSGRFGLDTYLGLGPFAASLMPPNWVTRYETLEKTERTDNRLDEKDSYVKVGDPVVQVIDLREIEQEDTQRAIEQEDTQRT